MKKTLLIPVVLSLLGFTLSAEARRGDRGVRDDYGYNRGRAPQTERLVVRMGDAHYRGQGNVIYLKRELKKEYPRLNLRNMKLESVRLVAKTKRGRGSAELVVDGREKDRSRVSGYPEDFHSSRPRTFDRVNLSNYGRSKGTWQIHLHGNFKVRKVVVFVKEKRGWDDGGHGRMRYKDVGEQRFDKWAYESETYYVNQRGVEEISLTGNTNPVRVQRVVAKMRNGSRKTLYALTGHYSKGEVKTAFIDGRYVQSVEVEAVSTKVSGSRGKLRMEVGYR